MPKTRIPPLPYGHQSVDDQDVAAVESVLRDDWITQGPRIPAFEAAVAERVGVGHAVAVSSGTAALHSACLAAELKDGTKAIVPTLTFGATAAAVRLTGAEVQFADIDSETLGLSAQTVEPLVTQETKAVIPVDFAGQPCDWDDLSEITSKHGITSIADAAHALGATYMARNVGSLADMTCFSFHPVKAITSAEGGMVLTDAESLAGRLREVRNHGIVRDAANHSSPDKKSEDAGPWYYEIQDIGLNYRISDIHCALGLSQLNKLDIFTNKRSALADRYTAAFADSELIDTPNVKADRSSAWHLYVIRLKLKALSWSRRQVFEALRDRGLGVQVHYMPLHLHPYYRLRYGHERGDFPIAEAYYDAALTLPLFPAMTERDIDDVVEIVMDVLGAARR
ncbi:MAG: UDP-4-amino-4,6-dideoxy-N-acetyl-beta-L-altrosamine transaminase [Alphaproteobacteria bacterium]|nr:UDP-4-amino-4,6-dideoxy-N-acetyl-beta-L-altrosamine transaminase [Alphaproteobacteria bacterium]